MSWDTGAFERLRQRSGPQRLPLIADFPDVLVDLSGLADLLLSGKLGQPLVRAVIALQDQMRTESTNGTAPDPNADPEAFWARHREVLRQQDELIAAVWLDPPWCKMGDLPADGTRPEGAVCIYDLSADERRFAADLPWVGVDALETFRPERRGAAPDGDGDGPPSEAEQLVSPAPAAPGVLAGPRPLAPSAAPRDARKRRHAS